MCYSEWIRKSAELEALEKARKETEELTRRAMKPRPAGGAADPRPAENAPAGRPEPVVS